LMYRYFVLTASSIWGKTCLDARYMSFAIKETKFKNGKVATC